MFRAEDLPADRAAWAPIFLGVIGSPDPNGRQLDGMGGGISSLSKICVIGPPTRARCRRRLHLRAGLGYGRAVDYSGNCGNMSSAVGPFAVDEGIVAATRRRGDSHESTTPTPRKIIVAHFPLDDGRAAVDGDFMLPGVAGSGAPVRLDFIEPGGAGTGKLLPTGKRRWTLRCCGRGRIEASMVDAANPCVFVAADALGMQRDRDAR